MRYHVIHIKPDFAKEWQKDLFDLHMGELGVDTIDENDYYIQSELWEEMHDEIEAFCGYTEGATLLGVEECPDENWNATWEAEHPMQELPLGIKIIPHCAFGAGHHETTSMMIDELIHHCSQFANHRYTRVLDHGTGTGVLAIFAKHLGADYVLAIDIDDKSVTNAQENAALNNVDIEVRLGATPPQGETFDLILANIHRNILLNNMEAYAQCLVSDGELWLSGFYESDCLTLIASAEAHELHHLATHANNEWRLLQFRK